MVTMMKTMIMTTTVKMMLKNGDDTDNDDRDEDSNDYDSVGDNG